jgi:lysophospholipase L1-like esterase
MNFKNYILFLAVFVFADMAIAQPGIPRFNKNERVVFVGNSITHGGHYHSFIWLYYMTRFPHQPVTVINAGIGGESAWDIKKRLDTDVFDRKPTYVVLTFGMNDTGYGIYLEKEAQKLADEQIKRSLDSYRDIETRMQSAEDIKVILLGGSPYDETSAINNFVLPGKNKSLLEINDAQRASAEKNDWGFVDFNRPMVEINRRIQKSDSTFSICGVDRIHPDNDGQMVMTYLFLKAQGLDRHKVAEFTIDAANLKTLYTENCKLSELHQNGGGVVFNYLANALPYPIDTVPRYGWGNTKSQHDALKLVPFTNEFNQEILRIRNLEKGNFLLKIDDEEIAEFSSEDLEKGINMALLTNTPQYRQAQQIMFLNEERFEIEKRFRDYYWVEYTFMRDKGLLFADNQQAIDTLNAHLPKDVFLQASSDNYIKAQTPEIRKVWSNYMQEIVETIYKVNKPVQHKMEVLKSHKL